MLESIWKNINDYNLADYIIILSEDENVIKEINKELSIVVSEQDILASSTLNKEQKYPFDLILKKVFTNEVATFFFGWWSKRNMKNIFVSC